MLKQINTALLIAGTVLLCSCGGGAGAPAGGQKIETSLSGQFQFDDSPRGTSSLRGLNGNVSLIGANGRLEATTQTTNSGNFTLTNVTGGEQLIKLEFDGGTDLNNDGSTDVELLLPVTVVEGQVNLVDGSISLADTDNDGVPDGLQLRTTINAILDLRLVEPVDGSVRIDDNGDGDCMNDHALRDLDGDGLPEDAHGRDHSLRGGVLKGPIESIDEATIVVNGISMNITDATRFKDRGNRNPDPSVFTEGTNVHLRGVFNGTKWTAIEVKTSGVRDQGSGNDDDDDDDSVAGDDDGDGDSGSGDDDSASGDDDNDDGSSGDAPGRPHK